MPDVWPLPVLRRAASGDRTAAVDAGARVSDYLAVGRFDRLSGWRVRIVRVADSDGRFVVLKQIGVAIFGLYLGFSIARGAMQVLSPPVPPPVPCYDFLNASEHVIVVFNKCTGHIELRILKKGRKAPPPASSEGAFLGPKVGV
jgi:hypothetical protein